MKRFKAVYSLAMLSAMLLALALMFSGCDLLGGDSGKEQNTYDPIIILGKDSGNHDIEVKFTTTRPVPKSITTARAALPWTPASNDSYEIRQDSKLVSNGTIQVNPPSITFSPAASYGISPFSGTFTGGKDLALDSIPTAAGNITGFYSPGNTKVKTPTATPGPSANFDPAGTVKLACETSGAVIRYTIDGTEPTSASAEYTGTAIQVKYTNYGPFIIKAIASKDNFKTSDVMTAEYRRNVETPTADKDSVPDNTNINLKSLTTGAKFIYTYTRNGETPTPPPTTFTGSQATNNGVTTGTGSTIKVSYDGDKPFKIMAIAVKDGYTASAAFQQTYERPKPAQVNGYEDMFGADTGAVKEDKDEKTVTINAIVKANVNITIPDDWTFTITQNGELTVPAGKTITVYGKLEVEGKLIAESGGKILVGNKGELNICAKRTIWALGGTGTGSERDGQFEGNGTVTIDNGGKMYIPNTEPSSNPTNDTDRFTLEDVNGEIKINAGGTLYLVGYETTAKEVWYPWVGTAESWDKAEKPVGADVALSSGSSIAINVYKTTIVGQDVYLPYMTLYGDATVLGPRTVKANGDLNDARSEVTFKAMFNINNKTLTVGDGSIQTILNIDSTVGAKILKGTDGKIILKDLSLIKGSEGDIIPSGVVYPDGTAIKYKDNGWAGLQPET